MIENKSLNKKKKSAKTAYGEALISPCQQHLKQKRCAILNNKSLEHFNVLLRIFFAKDVFQNFDVDFWLLLKAEKVLPPKRFLREKKFSFNFFSLSSI